MLWADTRLRGVLGAERWALAPSRWRDPWAESNVQIRWDLFALAGVSGTCRHADAALPCPRPLLSLSGTWEAGRGGSVTGGRGLDFALLVSPLPQVRCCLSK